MADFIFIVSHYIDTANNTRCIYFHTPSNFNYIPGQYITLILELNGREVRRPYSLSSVPALDPLPFISVKRIENGEVSRFLHQKLQIGDQLKVQAANGRFILPEKPPAHLCFFAAGSGIGPTFALVRQALQVTHSTVLLVYSNRSTEKTVFRDELLALEQHYGARFQIIWLFSNNKNLSKARLNRFLLEDIVKTHYPDLASVIFYTCGPFVYMEMIFISLLTLGVKQEQLYKETFIGPEDDDEDDGSLLEDENTPTYVDALVTLNQKGKQFHFTMLAHETLLQAAERNGIILTYSCRRGMCSSCVCQLKEGSIHLQYNQVLTDREVAEGRILTCMSRAITNHIVIETDE